MYLPEENLVEMSDNPVQLVVSGMVALILFGVAASLYFGDTSIAVNAAELAVSLGVPLVIIGAFGTIIYGLVTG